MIMPNVQVRRATVEDLPKLTALWKGEGLSAPALEKEFKDFQVAADQGGEILAAFAFHIAGTEGRIHSEAFAHPEQADELRTLLWERVQIKARNHGLVRIWTQLHTPFWHANGLRVPTGEIAAKLPAAFAGDPRPWLYLQLREDLPAELNLDKEFMLFRESEREQTQRMLRQARILKMLAGIISVVVLILVLVWAFFFMRLQSRSRPQGLAPHLAPALAALGIARGRP